MNKGCCSKCQAKAKKNPKKIRDESDEETVKVEVSEKENPKTESKEDKGFQGTVDQKKKKKKVLTWQHPSTKKEKAHHHGNNLLSEKTRVNPPCYAARPMMYHGGHNPFKLWPISTAFSVPYGYGGGGPIQPYQSMYGGAYISPYPPMPAASPYWQTRAFMDTNPMTRYTSYVDNYSYCYI